MSPLRCELCNNMTNGYQCKGYVICAYCKCKYDHVPDHISINQWGKYAKIKRKMSLLPKRSMDNVSV
jgi:hypothetical protein